MVESVHASVAEGTMSAPWGANHFAVGTQATGLKILEELAEIHVRVLLQIARVALPNHYAE